jgi:hypothetical protein
MTDSRVEAARLSLASAANYLDAVKHHVVAALDYLEGDARGRTAGALAHVYRAQAALAEIEKRQLINIAEIGGET